MLLSDMDAYWRAANYLSLGQMYLLANPLLREPLESRHVKPKITGRWDSTAGQNFIYIHLNRIIKEYDLNVIYVAGPGNGRVALIANAYLEGTYSELYPDITQDEEGLRQLFQQSCSARDAREGVEQDRPLCRAYGGACGKPDLLVACVIGDSDVETKPSSLRWEANEVVNPAIDGAVLPILQLTRHAIADSAILAGDGRESLLKFLHGNGYRPYFVEGDDPAKMHPLMAQSLDAIVLEIGHMQSAARLGTVRPPLAWPVLVVCTPGGWTAPQALKEQPLEETHRAPRVLLPEAHGNPAQLAMLSEWLHSYRPEELFDRNGRLYSELAQLAPKGVRRMSSNPRAIGGALVRDRI